MADTERKRLLSQQPRERGVGASGCASAFVIMFGLPFMAAGAAIGLLASGVIPPAAVNGTPMPSGLTWCLALLFFGAGVFLSSLGIRGLVERSRLNARRARYTREPWRVDYPWDAKGISHNPGSSLPGQIGAAAFMTLLLAPFNYFAFYAPPDDMPTWARALVGFFDVVLVSVVVGILLTLVQQPSTDARGWPSRRSRSSWARP